MAEVSTSFRTLISRIDPLQSELNRAAGHAASIRSRLESSFRLRKFITVGSHARETAIRWHSDVDHFAVFARDEFRKGNHYTSSTRVLDNIRDDLGGRFWRTPVSRDGPAVVVRFGAATTRSTSRRRSSGR
jgi:tRNA nucleotidyltransferase (CCA-adding enzyme)